MTSWNDFCQDSFVLVLFKETIMAPVRDLFTCTSKVIKVSKKYKKAVE
jgi:hypothetical protein